MHWGVAWVGRVTGDTILQSQKDMATFLRNAGAHVIVGCHSHTLQAHSLSKNSLIGYGLGSFVYGPRAKGFWVNLIQHSSTNVCTKIHNQPIALKNIK